MKIGTSDGASLAVTIVDENGNKDPYQILENLFPYLKKIPLMQLNQWLNRKNIAQNQTVVNPHNPANNRHTAAAAAVVVVERV